MSGSVLAAPPDPGVAVTFGPDIAATILDHFAKGLPFYKIAALPGMPNTRTMFEWKARYPDWASALAHAREARAEFLVGEGLDLIDSADPRGAKGVGAAKVRKASEQASYRRWLAGCLDRETYGDRTQVDAKVAVVHVDLGSLLPPLTLQPDRDVPEYDVKDASET